MIRRIPLARLFAACFALLGILVFTGDAQDRLKTMPGYDQYAKMSKEGLTAVTGGNLIATWKEDGLSFEYRKGGKLFRYDIAKQIETEVTSAKAEDEKGSKGNGPRGKRGGDAKGSPTFPFGPARGRQFISAPSPDGTLKAFYRERNIWLGDTRGILEMPLTTDANEKNRLKYGGASWVYGEELAQRQAMWWSPDGKKLAFYRFDESEVKDYYLAMNQTSTQDKVDAEPYPKCGTPNPVVDLLIYDLATKKTMTVDVRDGKPFENTAVGHYVYDIGWSPDGTELLFNRTNRRQNLMEFVGCDPATGKCRVIVREEWQASWVDNTPTKSFLADKKRFIWSSQHTGFRNYYLYDLSGKLHNPLTQHGFEVAGMVRVDEASGKFYYMAHSGDNAMKLQFHCVNFDGTGDKMLTDPKFHHAVNLAPGGKYFLDTAQTHDMPPATRLMDADGKLIAELAKSDTIKFEKLGLKKVELLTFKAADGVTDLHGMLHFPSQFEPSKKYPLLVSVYAGPETNGARETFVTPSALTEYGFLIASFDSRSSAGRGKKFLDAIYMKLGITEVDDQAAGVKSLWERPYVDKTRVGIFGTSYGGTVSATALLRYPDVFQAASASSAVTDYRLYDTIYAERYMATPSENEAGYKAASVMTYAKNLKGRLLLYYGTADNNVHPSNTLQLVKALQAAGKSFEVQVGPDQGHSSVMQPRMMEFFIENLVLKPGTDSLK